MVSPFVRVVLIIFALGTPIGTYFLIEYEAESEPLPGSVAPRHDVLVADDSEVPPIEVEEEFQPFSEAGATVEPVQSRELEDLAEETVVPLLPSPEFTDEQLRMLRLPQGEPRIVPLRFASDLVPIVSFVVTEAPYNADPTGRRDATEAFQQAIDDATKRPGTVFAPEGRYRIDGGLKIPPGITLRGEWKKPSQEDSVVGGTILLAYSGHGQSEGDPFINLDGGSVRDLNVYYPMQDAEAVVSYPLTVDVQGGGLLKNVTLVNPYFAIRSHSLSAIYNVYLCPLENGITAIRAGAVPRCIDIEMSTRFWADSGLKGAPTRASIRNAMEGEKARGIQIHRQDGGMFSRIVIEDLPTAVKFMPPHGWTYWYGLKTENVGIGMHFAGGSRHAASMAACDISARKNAILMSMDQTGWEGHTETWWRLSKNPNRFGTPSDNADLEIIESTLASGESTVMLDGSFKQEINFQNCTFASWGDDPEDFAVWSQTGVRQGGVKIFDSTFLGRERHVRSQGSPGYFLISGNTFPAPPDLQFDLEEAMEVDHQQFEEGREIDFTIQPVPATLPAKTDPQSLFVVSGPSDGIGDASDQIQQALDRAGANGGGTVYLTGGTFRVTRHLSVPPGVELRGVNDVMPRQFQIRTMILADLPDDIGKPWNPSFISLHSNETLGGSGLAGLCLLYQDQNYKEFLVYPWAIRGMGPGCWVRRVNLGNLYNGIDFATHNNDRHVIYRVTGSALNIAFGVGNSPTIGWIDSCQIRPQDWSIFSGSNLFVPVYGEHPTFDEIRRGEKFTLIPNLRGAGAITVTSGANVQIHGFFTNGATRAIDLIDHRRTGGGSAKVVVGGTEGAWGSDVHAVGEKGFTLIGFSYNPQSRMPHVTTDKIPANQFPKGLVMRIHESVGREAEINFVNSHYLTREEIKLNFDMRGGSFYMLQSKQEIGMADGNAFEVRGGKLIKRNSFTGRILQ